MMIIDILAYGMTACVVSTIFCIILDVDLHRFRNIVLTFTAASLIKKTYDYM